MTSLLLHPFLPAHKERDGMEKKITMPQYPEEFICLVYRVSTQTL